MNTLKQDYDRMIEDTHWSIVPPMEQEVVDAYWHYRALREKALERFAFDDFEALSEIANEGYRSFLKSFGYVRPQ